jgi:hypothetical protein
LLGGYAMGPVSGPGVITRCETLISGGWRSV